MSKNHAVTLEHDLDTVEGALSWALDKLYSTMSGKYAPGDPEWNDYRRAMDLLGGRDPDADFEEKERG